MNLLKFAAALIFIAPTSCQNLRADKVISNPSTKKGPASMLSEDSIVVYRARHLSRRLDLELEYVVVDDCIVGNLSGDETTTYCANEGLNCCSGDNSCDWDRKDVKICANSCTDEKSCYYGPSNVGAGSCTGKVSCSVFPGESVGANSCTSLEACMGVSGSVGDGSCNSKSACWYTGSVGNGSCNSGCQTCGGATSVGDCVEACYTSCQDNTDEIFNRDTSQCSHSASPTTAPSSSPSASPTPAPSSSPTSMPTQSLAKSGTELLTDAFNSLIDTDQSGFTNQLKHAINSALTDLESAKNVDLNTYNLFSAIEDTARAGKALRCHPDPNPSFEPVCDIILEVLEMLPSLA